MTDVEVKTRRVSLPDMFMHGAWLIERLKVKFPHLRDDTIHGWLRGMIDSKNFLFITNDFGVALAEQVYDSLSNKPSVREHFVLCAKPEYAKNAALLYADMLRWARGMEAEVMTVEQFSDVPRPMIKEQVGRIFVRETLITKVEKSFDQRGERKVG